MLNQLMSAGSIFLPFGGKQIVKSCLGGWGMGYVWYLHFFKSGLRCFFHPWNLYVSTVCCLAWVAKYSVVTWWDSLQIKTMGTLKSTKHKFRRWFSRSHWYLTIDNGAMRSLCCRLCYSNSFWLLLLTVLFLCFFSSLFFSFASSPPELNLIVYTPWLTSSLIN